MVGELQWEWQRYWARKVIGRMRCYGVAGLRSGEIPVEGMESRFAGKSARLRPFCLVLVVGSAVSIGTGGTFGGD
jgi:hypothetical protein